MSGREDMTTVLIRKDLHRSLDEQRPDGMNWADFMERVANGGDSDVYLFDADAVVEQLNGSLEAGEPLDEADERQVYVALDSLQEDVGTLADRLASLEATIDGLVQ